MLRREAVRVRSVALAVLLTLIGCSPGVAGRNVDGPSGLVGAPAVSFDVPTTRGVADGLARHRGSVVLLNIWATWCPPCQAEMPALERLYRDERRRGLVVLGVDQGESAGAAAAFARAHGVTFPILVDERQRYGRSYAAVGLPTSVIVGRDGRIVAGVDGALSYERMRALVDPLLARA